MLNAQKWVNTPVGGLAKVSIESDARLLGDTSLVMQAVENVVRDTASILNPAYWDKLEGAQKPFWESIEKGSYTEYMLKKAKEAKRKQHVVEVKSLRLSPIIDTHDFETKVRQTSKWIEAGMKVKIDMRFRGRLITRLEVGRKIMNDFIEAMDEVAIVEKKPSMEGNTMSTVLAPKKK